MMQPVAYLALLNLPGQNKLRNLRYYLGRGDNVIGSDPRCQIVLPAKYEMPHHIANIRIGHNFLTIEALHPHLLYLQANLTKNSRDAQVDNYFLMPTNTQYLPRLGEFFFIGRMKAIIAAPPLHELTMMNGIANAASFQLPTEAERSRREEPRGERMEDIFGNVTLQDTLPPEHRSNYDLFEQFAQSDNKIQSKVESKIIPAPNAVPEEEERSHTEVLDQQNYQATLLLEEGVYAYQPTINLDEPAPKYSQQLLMNEIRRKEEQSRSQPQREEEDFSMPDTIIDRDIVQQNHENKPHIEQIESKEEEKGGELDDEMPPTIKEDEPPNQPQRIKATRTMGIEPKDPLTNDKLYKSGPLPNDSSKFSEQSQEKPIQDFDDLFGMSASAKPTTALKHQASEPVSEGKDISLMQMSSLKFASMPEKEPSSDSARREEEAVGEHRQKVHFVGFKPTAAHREFLKKQQLDIVGSPDAEYDILLVKEPLRLTNRLLIALIDGKRIETEQWIFNKQAQIQSKLNGHPWKQVYERRGTHTHLLKGKGRFYISKRLQELMQGVIEALGGEVISQLNDKKRVINVILRADDSQDTELYLKHHENKKWRFLKSEIIVDAVLTARYSLEEKYVIKLFDD